MPRQRIALPTGTVSYLEWTPDRPTRRTVLLLHGGGIDSASLSWGELGPALAAAGFRVIAPDHPGFGHSDPARVPITQETLVEYVGQFVDALHLDDYVVGGLSLGGGLTLGHTLERLDSIAGMVLFGSYGSYGITPRLTDGAFSLPTQLATWAMLRTGMLAAATRWYLATPQRVEKSIHPIITHPSRRTPELLAEIAEEAARSSGMATFAQWQRDQVLPTRQRTDYSSRLGDITVPALVVHGTADTGVPVARAQGAADALPNGRLVTLLGAGHWVQRDRPGEVARKVIEFINER